MISSEMLAKIKLFSTLSPESLERIVPHLTVREYDAEVTIIYRGDPGYCMFMILSGSVAVTRLNDEGFQYTLAQLDAGDHFGEMALMTGEPRTANVKSLTRVTLLELSQETFNLLTTDHPELNSSLLHIVARRLNNTALLQQKNVENLHLLAKLLYVQKKPELDYFPGITKWTKELNDTIVRLAESSSDVLIHGERGSGKELVARLIHFHNKRELRPLLHLDCQNPPPVSREEQERTEGRPDELHLEAAQEAALFGHGANVASYARGIRRGSLELADGGMLILENVEYLTPLVQRLFAEYLRESSFSRKGETGLLVSRVRIIATTGDTRNINRITPELLQLLQGETLTLKPLRERKKDIPVVAAHLLEHYNKKFGRSVTGFSKEALHALVDHDWPLNGDELSQVIERAVAVCDGELIEGRQIFLKVPSFSPIGKFNLLLIPALEQLVHNPIFPACLSWVSVPFIILLMLSTLFGGQQNNVANLVVWGVWWPFLICSIFVSARSWCGYCPMPAISDAVNRLRTTFRPLPDRLGKHGVWISLIGFILILQAEHLTHMFTNARATGILLVAILFCTIVTNFFFGKRSWCKYLCPLGKMVGHYSMISLLELGSNSNVCASQCQSPDCVKDRKCPMGLHPSAASATKECVMCLCCVKSCKHKSVRIDARFPWQEMLVKEKWDYSGAWFTIFLVASVLAVKIPDFGPYRLLTDFLGLRGPLQLSLAEVLVSCVVMLFCAVATAFASGAPSDKEWQRNFTLAGHAYLFLALSGFFNIYLHEFVYYGHNLLPWGLDLIGLAVYVPKGWITPNLGTMKALVPIITLAGAIPSLLMLKMIVRKYSLAPVLYRRHRAILLGISLVLLVIL